ncbi:hypothetical protein KMT30_27685 [Streptomyces sp. IBSBF 2953]|uniref:hypothetical protein n=1 Tax=Streptomyces TaxID=1883 RepID=UPI00211A53C4|nr:hypothetical protein [Streptomyces scabiei]MCQ9182760.1 hypothetical protein [Streptomyces hayashii]MDX3115401.1 hypothetical protein [Streptomyces scabiei]
MTPTFSAAPGRHRQLFVPSRPESARAGSVPPAPPAAQDPPIYRDLLRTWADRGRTLPGRHDPEWVRLVAPQVRPGQFGGSADSLSDVR